jgi:hypothetical protein
VVPNKVWHAQVFIDQRYVDVVVWATGDNCSKYKPRGLLVDKHDNRLTDEEWKAKLDSPAAPPPLDWIAPFVAKYQPAPFAPDLPFPQPRARPGAGLFFACPPVTRCFSRAVRLGLPLL